MKKITLFQEGVEKLELYDNSNENKVDYAKKLSCLFELPNISLLELSESITIIRPSKIVAINILDIVDKEGSNKVEKIDDSDEDKIRE